MNNNNPQRSRRLAMIISGAMDAVIGIAILLISFGFFPIDLDAMGIPVWAAWLVGGALFISGTWMVVYNYSRLEE